jgi:DNA-binding NarL/FixJ family response regulator
MTLRVLLVDDQMLIRQGIKSLLHLSGQVEVVAEASDGSTVVDLAELHQPDVILLDLSMPKVDGIATLELLKQQQSKTPVLILTTFEEHDLVLKSIQLGAKGYLLKDVSLDSLVSAIQTLQQGGTCFQSTITERLLAGLGQVSNYPRPAAIEELSEKELQILQLMACGYANKEIAGALYKSEGTIKNQISSILAKLGVRDRTRAVLLALELGLIH